jgi:hypothetical protein
MEFHKFKHHHAKQALDFGNSIFRFKITRIVMLLLRIKKKIIYIDSEPRQMIVFYYNLESIPLVY